MSVLHAISELGVANDGKHDKETHKMIKQVIKCMEDGNTKWPTNNLCKVVHNLDDYSKALFLEILHDMDKGLEEYYGPAEV